MSAHSRGFGAERTIKRLKVDVFYISVVASVTNVTFFLLSICLQGQELFLFWMQREHFTFC